MPRRSLTVEAANARRRHYGQLTAAIGLGKLAAKEPVYAPGKGIEFPSNDGFLIHLDFTAIWGITPEQAPGSRPPVRHCSATSSRR